MNYQLHLCKNFKPMKALVHKNNSKSDSFSLSVEIKLNKISGIQIFRFLAVVFFGILSLVAVQSGSPFAYEILMGGSILAMVLLVATISKNQTIHK